jgi:hypothetical protein
MQIITYFDCDACKVFFNQIIFQSLFNLKLIELPLSEM